MTGAERAALHSPSLIHEGDGEPVRVFANGDVTDMILSVPKQARIGAGRDIVNMMYLGQNMAESDLTRIIAGRDINQETIMTRPTHPSAILGAPHPAFHGNTSVLVRPGRL